MLSYELCVGPVFCCIDSVYGSMVINKLLLYRLWHKYKTNEKWKIVTIVLKKYENYIDSK